LILIDNNQIILANIFQTIKQVDNIDENILRHMVLNTYRMYRSKFKHEYGELVICHDSSNCWRKDLFEYYKQNRKTKQDESNIDWKSIYDALHKIRTEIDENFPYNNVKVERTEADDIIAVLCKKYSSTEKILILSSDKDFKQLQKFENVNQYSCMKKDYLVCDDPSSFLVDHIIRGDVSDGIPNILSDDDTFVVKTKRQKRLTTAVVNDISETYNMTGSPPEYCLTGWNRNKKMIDLESIPDIIQEEIIKQYQTNSHGDRSKILNYMIENRLKNLIGNLEDF
jgi:hypothetical protein